MAFQSLKALKNKHKVVLNMVLPIFEIFFTTHIEYDINPRRKNWIMFQPQLSGWNYRLVMLEKKTSKNLTLGGVNESSSWWLNQPIWKICNRQIGSFPQGPGWK